MLVVSFTPGDRIFMTFYRSAVLNLNMMTGDVMGGRGSCVRLPAITRNISSRSRDRPTLGGWVMKPIASERRRGVVPPLFYPTSWSCT